MHGREGSLFQRRLKSKDIVQTTDNYGGRDFWYKKVLSKPRKPDKESEEQICWEEFQKAGATKEKDLRLIFDRISEEILVGARIFGRELEEM